MARKSVKKVEVDDRSKMQKMRDKYNELILGYEKKEQENKELISENDKKIVDLEIKSINIILQKIEGKDLIHNRPNINDIHGKIKVIKKYNLTVEQAKKISDILLDDRLCSINGVNAYLKTIRSEIERKLTEAVSRELDEIDNIEELKTRYRENLKLVKIDNAILRQSLSSKVQGKTYKMQMELAAKKTHNDVSENIENILNQIVEGKLDIEEANKIIEQEAIRIINGRKGNKVLITQEQEENQIKYQIQKKIAEQYEKYPVKNPKESALLISELSNGGLGLSVRAIVDNLLGRKKFDEAKELCKSFLDRQYRDEINYKEIKNLRNKIRNYEVGDMVLRGLRSDWSKEEDEEYYKLIKKGIELENVELDQIVLGKSKDGLRTVTLKSIWPEEIEKER